MCLVNLIEFRCHAIKVIPESVGSDRTLAGCFPAALCEGYAITKYSQKIVDHILIGSGKFWHISECFYKSEVTGSEHETTNNRMELMAAIGGLSAIKQPADVTVHSDADYLINAFNQKWLEKWSRNGWINANKRPVENRDLWERLLELTKKHNVTFVKVKGHAGDPDNERCDALAKNAAMKAAMS